MANILFPVSTPIPGALQRSAMNAIAARYICEEPDHSDLESLITLNQRISKAIQKLPTVGTDNAFADDYVFFQCVGLVGGCALPHEEIAVGQNGTKDFRYKVLTWMNRWDERFSGWIHRPELETEPRMTAIMQFLNFWSRQELLQHTNEVRGSVRWIIEQGIWTENRSAGFDPDLQRHLTHDEV
jgi:hypothetical protein